MVLCVRDEQEFLAANLTYHQALGVERAYVFLDRCGDRTPQIARSFPWVRTLERDRRTEDRFMSEHQVRCLDEALGMARAEGFDWLLHLDPDEFAWGAGGDRHWPWPRSRGGRHGSSPPEVVGALPPMLASLKPRVEQVILRTKEVVPRPVNPDSPFWDLVEFQDRRVLQREILDPSSGELRELDYWIGGRRGKSIVRTNADVRAQSAHSWTRAGAPDETPIPTVRRGHHYHFVVVNPNQWRSKYRKFSEFPDKWSSGRAVRFPKQAWKDASRSMTEEQARDYYMRWVAVQDDQLAEALRKGIVVRETHVRDVLERVYEPARVSARDRAAASPGT